MGSCANNYQCSHPKLDQLVELSKQSGALGAGLTGAGWGGCIVALVPESQTDQYINFLQANYYQIFSSFWNHRLGHSSHIYIKQRCQSTGISRPWANLVELSN